MPKPVRMPSGRYLLRYTDPEGNRRSTTFDTMRQADDWYARMRVDMRDGRWVNPDNGQRLFADWAQEVFELKRPRRRANTDELHRQLYRSFIEPRWGTTPLGGLHKNTIGRWVAELSNPEKTQKARWDRETKTYVRDGGPLAPETVSKVWNTFRTIVVAAVDAGMILNPLPREPALPEIVRKQDRYLKDAEVAHLASFFRPQYQALIYVCCYGGLRIGEAAALQLRDVDWALNRLVVHQGQTEVKDVIDYTATKTKDGRRSVPLPDLAISWLRAHVEAFVGWADPDAFVFRSPTEQVFRIRTWRRREWVPAVKAAGLAPLTPHDMRHTAASIMISEGANRWQLAQNLGHRDTRMVDRVYGHLFDDDQEALRQRISARADREQAGAVVIDLARARVIPGRHASG